MADLLWTEDEEDRAWDEGGPIGVQRLAIERYAANYERLSDENERLREALERICQTYDHALGGGTAMARIARKALTEGKHQRVPDMGDAASDTERGF